MKKLLILSLMLASANLLGQSNQPLSTIDGRSWGVVLQHPGTKDVVLNADVTYLSDSKGALKMDIYSPPSLKKGEKRPAIIFLNAIGDQPGEIKVKSWGTYQSWPRLIAANGYIGISMECDGSRVQESLKGIFNYIASSGETHHIDANRLGVYAASANVNGAGEYVMGKDANPGIKAAVLYYGGVPQGPFRKDLPVYFVIAEGDVNRTDYRNVWIEVMKNNAPWTITMGSNMIHAFDSFSDNDDSRKLIKETISFWKNNLDPIPPHTWPNSLGREILAAQYGHDDAKSIELLEKYIALHPDDADALFQYASALKNVRRYPESETAYRSVLVHQPNNVYALTYLYQLMFILNRPDEAEPFLTKAEKIGGINPYVYMGMGYTMYSLNKHKEGVKFFEKVTESLPTGVNFYNVACGYAMIGDKDKAFTALNKAIEAGFTSRQQYETDMDLASLRNDNRYNELLGKLR